VLLNSLRCGPPKPCAAASLNITLTLARFRFWVLLRWKEDGATLIFGHAPHFAHELEEHDDKGVLYKPHGGAKPSAGH
jgi:hypothetical protein